MLLSNDMYEVINFYCEFGFNLTKVSNKQPVLPSWNELINKSPRVWVEWLQEGYGLGLLCGKSSMVTVVDVDIKPVPGGLRMLLNNTLWQETGKGFHYVFRYDPDFPSTRIDELSTDILNDNRQVIIPPSMVDGKYRRWGNMVEPMPMDSELKDFLLSKVDSRLPKTPLSLSSEPIVEGNRNNTLIHLGGVLRQWENPEQVAKTLWLINNHFVNPPLPKEEVLAMAKSIDKYNSQDFAKLEDKVFEYLKMTEGATIHDIKDFLKEDRTKVDIALYNLKEAERVLKSGNRFYVLTKVQWKDSFTFETGNRVPFKVPYFNEIAEFNWGDMILIGGKPSVGKTTISMNIAKQLSLQGVIPYYINLENSSRFGQTATRLGLKAGEIRWATSSDPRTIEIERNVVTIVDWLLVEDKCETDVVFKYFSEQLQQKGGFLILFQQLKDNNEYFAPNMSKQFPSFSARYIYDDETKNREFGCFRIDKNREPKGRWVGKLPCRYDRDTMVLDLLDTEYPPEMMKIKEIFGATEDRC